MTVLIQVDANSGVPVFRQIMDQVRFHIASGLLVAGDELPSTRGLSQELGVNPMTVSKAFSLLEQEGLLERRAGLPLIVRALPSHQAERERLDILRAALTSAVTAAQQLDISASRAARIFRDMLTDTTADTTGSDDNDTAEEVK